MKYISFFLFTTLFFLYLISISLGQKLELVTQSGHSNIVWTCSFSPDGKLLASAGPDGTVKLWDVKSGKEVRTFYENSEGFLSLCFSPDGKILAAGTSDGTVILWSVTDGSAISKIKKKGTNIECLSFSPDGKILAAGGNKEGFIHILDIERGEEFFTLAGHSRAVISLAFFKNEKILASAGEDGTIRLWDLNNKGKETALFNVSSHIYSMSLTSDGKYLACVCEYKENNSFNIKTKILDVSTGHEIYSLGGHSDITSVSFSPDGKLLATGGQDKKIILWDRLSGHEIFKVEAFPSSIESVSFSPDGMILAIACDDYRIRLLDISIITPSGDISSQIKTLEGKSNNISSVCFSGSILACITGKETFGKYTFGKGKKSLLMWDLLSGKPLMPFEEMDNYLPFSSTGENQSIDSIVFSHDGKILAGKNASSVKLWDVKTGKLIKTIEDRESHFNTIAFTGDDRIIATGGVKCIKLYDLQEDRELLSFKDLPNTVTSLSFSDTVLACGIMRDMTGKKNNIAVIIIDIKTGKEIHNFETTDEGETFALFSPDGKILAACYENSKIKLFDTDTWDEILQFEGLPPLSFSPDGTILAWADKNKRVKLLNISDGKEILTLKGHSDKINSISFSPSGKIIATGGDDMKIRLWDSNSGKEKGSIISTDESDWAVITEDCRFDATLKGMKTIHFVTNNIPVMLFQLKDCYYEPGLLGKITGFNSEPYREIIPLKDLHIFPEIKASPPGKDKKLTVRLLDQGGGTGRVQIYLDNKEIGTYEGKDTINIDLSGFSFLPGEKHIITIIAWNREGYLSNGGIEVPWVVKGEE